MKKTVVLAAIGLIAGLLIVAWIPARPALIAPVEQPVEWIVIVSVGEKEPHKFSAKATHVRLVPSGMDTCVELLTNGRVTAGFCGVIGFGREEK